MFWRQAQWREPGGGPLLLTVAAAVSYIRKLES